MSVGLPEHGDHRSERAGDNVHSLDEALDRSEVRFMDDTIINTPDGPMTWAEWKKKNPVQVPSRRTKGKKLPNKIKLRSDD